MADSEEAKLELDYESDADGVSALRWTARRMEATDDDDDDDDAGQEAKENYQWSCVCDLPRDESDGGEGSSQFYDEIEGVGVLAEELEVVSQEEEEEEVQETVRRVNNAKAKEKAVTVSDEVCVPRTGSFYMHDDRFLSRRYGTRRGAMVGMKLWECTDGSKWKHDKFEDMTDKRAPKSNCQLQRKNRTKGHRYADTNQFGSLDNYGNQNNKTSRMVRGRGPVKYKPIVKSNNLNLSSQHQIPVKLKERTTSSRSSQVSSRASSHDVFMPRRSNERYSRRNKQLVSLRMGGEMTSYHFPSQQTYQPYSIQENQNNDNGIPLPPLCSQQLTRHPGNEYRQTSFKYLAANSSVEALPQTTSLGHDLVGRGSYRFRGSPSLSPVIQHGGLPYGAFDDHAPNMALVSHAPLSHLGSRNGGKPSYKTWK